MLYVKEISETKSKTNFDDTNRISHDRLIITNYIQNCIEQVATPLVFEIGKKGGTSNPNSAVYWNGTELNILAIYKNGYINKLLLRQSIEAEISDKINKTLKSCINLSIFEKQGFSFSEKETIVNATINVDGLFIKLSYPLNFKKTQYSLEFNDFISRVNLPLGELYLVAIDIVNEEIKSGHFDKEDFMLKHKYIRIEKHRPYPDIIYIIKKFDIKSGKDLVFQFAIKGEETVGRKIIKYESDYGCCINKIDGMCFKNVEPSKCANNIYKKDTNCECEKNIKQDIEGCCISGDDCQFITEQECSSTSGEFYKNDFRCSQSYCHNLNCKSTYNYTADDFSGPLKKHGESWCSYESLVGKGLDYVGTRHFLHSCINGVEYAEECRDYREEMCTEGMISVNDKIYSKGICRINRWYDCGMQKTESACKDTKVRDCYWSGFLYSQLKCHPEVPPGFKFWEENGKQICNIASLYKDSDGKKYPKSWGHSALLYCQRTGDCGNYRNYADEITEFGFYNKDGAPQRWVYWNNSYTKRGNDFVVGLGLYATNLSSSASMPRGFDRGDARCNLWGAPLTGKCELCMNTKLHPCTEYRCKSLGKNCIFIKANNSCIPTENLDITPPKISIGELQRGYKLETRSSTNYRNGIENIITPDVMVHQAFSFSFSTSKPTRCKISLYSPNVNENPNILIQNPLPDILLNELDYETKYNATLRFPSSSFTKFSAYPLFIRCIDSFGNKNDGEFVIKVKTIEDLDNIYTPKILKVEKEQSNIVKDSENKFNIYVNEPFNLCRHSFSDVEFYSMNPINCKTEEEDIIYDVNHPLGSYVCNASIFIPNDASQVYFSCEDKNGNKSNSYFYNLN